MTNPATAVPEGGWNPAPRRATSTYDAGRAGRSLRGRWRYRQGDSEAGKDAPPDHGAGCRRQQAGPDPRVATGSSGAGRSPGKLPDE